MRSCKRSLAAIVMLIFFSMPPGIFLSWKVQHLIVRHIMMERLEQAHLQTIEIPATSVQWHEEDREIIVDGKMFDVKSYQTIAGTVNIRFTGLFDEAETELEEKLKRFLQQNEKNDPGKNVLAWLFFSPLHDGQALPHCYAFAANSLRHHLSEHITHTDLSIPAPPPRS